MTGPPDGMARSRIPVNLPDLVSKAFHSARATGDVHFFPTQVTLVKVNSVPVGSWSAKTDLTPEV